MAEQITEKIQSAMADNEADTDGGTSSMDNQWRTCITDKMEDMCAVSRQLVDNQVMLSAPAATKDAYFSTMHANAMLTAENRRKRLDLIGFHPRSPKMNHG